MNPLRPFRPVRLPAVLGGLCAAILLLNACDRPQPPGSAPAADRIPQRIISLAPNATEILFDIGLGERVVAVSEYCRYPEAANDLPRVGGLTDPNVEKIAALKPDLILSYQNSSRLEEFAEKRRIDLLILSVETIDDVTRAMLIIGERAGILPETRARVADFSRRLHRTAAALRDLPPRRVLFVVGRDAGSLKNLYVAGPDTFIDEMITLAGGINVVSDTASRYPILDKEAILMSRPDVIIEGFHGERFGGDALQRQRAEWASLSALPAVRDGHIRFYLGDRMTVPGPGIPESLATLAGLIHHIDPAALEDRGVVQRMQR